VGWTSASVEAVNTKKQELVGLKQAHESIVREIRASQEGSIYY
jgi:hypothetical protein